MSSKAFGLDMKPWESRLDVIYHFHAYRYFSHFGSAQAIDIINLNDGDVQFYNRNSDMTRGLSSHHELANYLNRFTLPNLAPFDSTHRKLLIAHVRQYNLTAEPRRRFYMIGLSPQEIDFLKSFENLSQPAQGERDSATGGASLLVFATDGCLDGYHEVEDARQEEGVKREIAKCLDAYRISRQAPHNETVVEDNKGKYSKHLLSVVSEDEDEGGVEL